MRSNRGDTVYFHITHRIVVMSADHFFFIEGGRIHGAERFQASLQDGRWPEVSFDFAESEIRNRDHINGSGIRRKVEEDVTNYR